MTRQFSEKKSTCQRGQTMSGRGESSSVDGSQSEAIFEEELIPSTIH